MMIGDKKKRLDILFEFMLYLKYKNGDAMNKFMKDYWNKKFHYGGLIKTRHEIYKDLKTKAPNEKCIELYMLHLSKQEVKS